MKGLLRWLFRPIPDGYAYLIVKIEQETARVGDHTKVHTHVNMRASATLTIKDQLDLLREAANELERRMSAGESEVWKL